MQAQTDMDLLKLEAPLPVMPVPQVNVSPVRTLEALTGIIENLWNPDAGQPPEHLTHATQKSRQILQTSSVFMFQEGCAAFGHQIRRRTGSPAMGSGRRRRRGDGRLRGGACSGWAAGRSNGVKGTKSRNGENFDNTAAEEDAHRGANGCGEGFSPVLAGPKVVSSSCDESQRHGTFGAVAMCLCDHPSIGKFLRGCITIICFVALVCSGMHPGRHWPACFDQTKNGQKCRKCHVWACNTACGRYVANLQCCRMSSVVSPDSQSQSCPRGVGSSEVKGTPRLTQGMEQAMDVQMAAVQCDLQPPSERVAYRAALQVVPTVFPAVVAAPMAVENGQPMHIDLAAPRACQEEPQGSAQAPGLRSSVHLVRGEAVGAGDVNAGDANHQAPAAGPEAKDVHGTQEVVATSHALPSPVDQAT